MRVKKVYILHAISGILIMLLVYIIGFQDNNQSKMSFSSLSDVPQLKEAFVPIKERVLKELVEDRVSDIVSSNWLEIEKDESRIIITGKDYALFKVAFLGDLGLQNKVTWDSCLHKIDSLCSYDGKLTLTLSVFRNSSDGKEYVRVPAGMLRELLKERIKK